MEKIAIMRIIVQLTLFVLYIYLFAIDSVRTYLEMKTYVIHEKKATTGIPAPVVTFCPRNKKTQVGWKTDQFYGLDSTCKEHGKDAVACIDQETYQRQDFINDPALAAKKPVTLLTNASWWTKDLGSIWHGVCQSINYPDKIGTDFHKHAMWFYLDKTLNYRIFVHDKNYFEMFTNPLRFPSFRIDLDTDFSHYNMLTLTEHWEMNVPQDPCEEDSGYDFRGCVKESFSRQVGCRSNYDRWSDQGRNVCSEMGGYRKLDDLYYNLDLADNIGEFTGCNKPCHYLQYKLFGDKTPFLKTGKEDFLAFGLWSIDNKISMETEELIHPWPSLVAEIGGTLGLFVGFSFMMIWDGVEMVVELKRTLQEKLKNGVAPF